MVASAVWSSNMSSARCSTPRGTGSSTAKSAANYMDQPLYLFGRRNSALITLAVRRDSDRA